MIIRFFPISNPLPMVINTLRYLDKQPSYAASAAYSAAAARTYAAAAAAAQANPTMASYMAATTGYALPLCFILKFNPNNFSILVMEEILPNHTWDTASDQ